MGEKRREEKRREEKEKDKKDKKDKDKDAPAPMAKIGKAKTAGDVKVVIKDKVKAGFAGVKKENAKRADDVEGEKEKEPKLDKASKPDEKRREEKRREREGQERQERQGQRCASTDGKNWEGEGCSTSKSLSRTRSTRASRRGTRR